MFLLLTTFIFCSGTSFVYSAMTPEEIQALKTGTEPYVMECYQELSLTKDQFHDLLDKGDDKASCLFACVLKKIGIFDKNAMIDIPKATEFHKLYIKREESFAEIENVTKECSKVNDESVNDGDKGCERAKLFMECIKEHRATILI